MNFRFFMLLAHPALFWLTFAEKPYHAYQICT
nr:MAG TPA: hypothetical protein [Caudoviricetes sp.]